MTFWVYIVASRPGGTLYVGQTNSLPLRISQHKAGTFSDAFSKKYKTNLLVHMELFQNREDARTRESHLKKYSRLQKLKLISDNNPDWRDLSLGF
jgi:putative endonuclease